MAKEIKINDTIQTKMGEEWQIEVSAKPFIDEKGANMPSFGYPCGVCASSETKLRFAKSTDEEQSLLEWIELQCKDCKSYTLYTRKEQ